jgi:alkylated DNA repair dioxygenase AlkB
MSSVRQGRCHLAAELSVVRAWQPDCGVLAALRKCFTYDGEDRATGSLYAPADGQGWPPPLAEAGPRLLGDLAAVTGVKFTICAFQAYRDGSGCGWHADEPFGAQAILSLGATRTFGVRRAGGNPRWMKVAHGDLVFMPDGFQQEWEHCVPVEGVAGERCALVFRTRR